MRFFKRKKTLNSSPTSFLKLRIVCVVCFVLILALSVFLSFKLGIFNIKKIEVNIMNNLGCASINQLKEAPQLLGRNLFLIDSVNTSKNIKEKFICVKDVHLSKLFPDKVKLDVLGREPKAKLFNLKNEATMSASLESIATPSAGEPQDTYLVDEEVIFEKSTNQVVVPGIFLDDSNLSLGRKVDYLIRDSLNILEKLKILGLNIQTTQIIDVDYNSRDAQIIAQYFVVFPNNSQPRIIFRLQKDINAQIASLQLILEKAKINRGTVPTEVGINRGTVPLSGIDESSIEFIDLRFDKPIVKFAPKKNGQR